MIFSHESKSSSLIAAERILLRALCYRETLSALRIEILENAKGHRFRDPENEIIFRALQETEPPRWPDLKSGLSAHLTRLGFPDVHLDELFSLPPPGRPEIRAALDSLADARVAKT